MKKTKLVLATLAAAVCAASAGALVACSNNNATSGGSGGGGGGGADKVYTITFDANGGTLAGENTQKTKSDGTLVSLPTEARVVYEGHSFDGWYTAKDDGTGVKVTTSYSFDSSITVYAHWNIISDTESVGGESTFTITFHANNGTDEKQELTTDTGGHLTDGAPVFSYAGHKFDGWYTLAEGGDGVALSQKFGVNANVYAHWTLDEGNSGEEEGNDPIEYAECYLTGTFNEWTTDDDKYKFRVKPYEYDPDVDQYYLKVTFEADGTQFKIFMDGTYYAHLQTEVSSKVATGGGYGAAGDITVEKAGTYEIYFKVYKAGNEDGSHDIWIQEAEPELTEPAVHPVAAISGETMIDNTSEIDKALYPTQLLEYKKAHVELYAGDTVSFTLDDAPQKVYVEKNSIQIDVTDTKNPLDEVTVLKDGYYDLYLKMWNNGHWTVYGEKVADLEVEAGDIYTVTFNANGGSVTTASAQTDEYGKLESLPSAADVTPPEGMKFDGWFTQATGGVQIDTDKIYNKDTAIFAHYIIDVSLLTASFKVNGAPTALINNNESVPSENQTAVREYYITGVTLNKNDEITFVAEDEDLNKFNTHNCHGVIKSGNKFTVYETGTFSIYVRYYEAEGENLANWTIEMTDGKVDQCEDGYYLVGSINSWSPWNMHQLNASGSITLRLEKGDEFKIAKVEGNDIKWTDSYSAGNVEATSKKFISGTGDSNIIIRNDGTYTITLKSGKITITSSDVIIDDDDNSMVPVVDGNQDSSHPNVYLIINGDKTQGYFVEWKSGSEYYVTVELHAGDRVAIYVPSWNLVVTVLENGADIESTAKANNEDENNKYIEIYEDHTYTFYYKNEYDNDRIYLAWD